MISPRIFEVLCHLHGELEPRIQTTGDGPCLGAIIETFSKDALQLQQILFDARIILPPQQQDRNTGVWRPIGLRVYKHSRILEVSGKRLEISALGRGGGILNGRVRLVVILDLLILYPLSVGWVKDRSRGCIYRIEERFFRNFRGQTAFLVRRLHGGREATITSTTSN